VTGTVFTIECNYILVSYLNYEQKLLARKRILSQTLFINAAGTALDVIIQMVTHAKKLCRHSVQQKLGLTRMTFNRVHTSAKAADPAKFYC